MGGEAGGEEGLQTDEAPTFASVLAKSAGQQNRRHSVASALNILRRGDGLHGGKKLRSYKQACLFLKSQENCTHRA